MLKTKPNKSGLYLAGAIEKAADGGVGWRNELTLSLELKGYKILDPIVLEDNKLKGLHVNKLPEGYNHWHEMKHSTNPKDFARFLKYMRVIIKRDLEIIDGCEALIVLWDKAAARGAGTHGEMTYAFDHDIPVYTVKKCELPGWLTGCSTKIFNSFEDLLKEVNTRRVNDEVNSTK